MKYELYVNDDIAKDVYSLSSFDSEWSGTERTLSRVIAFIEKIAQDQAMAVCTDTIAGQEERKSYDRGYVKGLFEATKFLKIAAKKGRLMQFPNERNSERPSRIV